MSMPIVLLHGSANGAYSWRDTRAPLVAAGVEVVTPDMLGYGKAEAPSDAYSIDEEMDHLDHVVLASVGGPFHLVAHSLGAMFALHFRLRHIDAVKRLTLLDPVTVSVLRENSDQAGYDEMEAQYEAFMSRLPDADAAARAFVEHWSGDGAWSSIGDRARAVIRTLVPKVRWEMLTARKDRTALGAFAVAPPPTRIVVGERTRVAPRATSHQLATAFGAHIEVISCAGHMLPLTHPGEVAAEILNNHADAGA